MKAHSPISIRHKLQSLSLFLVLTTSILGMATTLLFSLRMEYQNLDRNLMNSAQVLAQSPDVADFLAHRADSSVLTHYLNGTISRVQDIDAIVVADHNGRHPVLPGPRLCGDGLPGCGYAHGPAGGTDRGGHRRRHLRRGAPGPRCGPGSGRLPAGLCIRGHRGAQRPPDRARHRGLLRHPDFPGRRRRPGPVPQPVPLHQGRPAGL